MKLQEILTTFTLAILTTVALQYFFGPSRSQSSNCQQTVSEGGRMTAPDASTPLYGPLKKEVSFDAPYDNEKVEFTTLETPLGSYTFSSYGAVLEKIALNRLGKGEECAAPLVTLSADYPAEHEHKCFLIALEEETPAYYTLTDMQELPEMYQLSYKNESAQGVIHKTFVVHKNTYALDVTLRFEPAAEVSMRPRIMMPAPHIKDLTTAEMVQGIISPAGAVSSLTINVDVLKDFWVKPSIFGIQDRYFVHSLIKEEPRLIERGYFAMNDLEYGQAFLEGARITHPLTAHLSFYIGPKKEAALKAVDERLLPLLTSGWFAPITRPLTNLLLKILHALYQLVHNYGLAIILLTLLLKLLLLPFSWGSEKSAKDRAEFQRKMRYLEEKYKHDKQALASAQAELIRQKGLSSLGGCLPNLLQLPFFIVLGTVISNSIELYKAPFLWIADLSAPDPLYILPLLVAGSMLATPIAGTDARQRISMIVAGLLFGAFSTKLAAGLVLYIATNTLFGIAQTYLSRVFAR
jgi:YidC/Oxa1 family membrane protein insertase